MVISGNRFQFAEHQPEDMDEIHYAVAGHDHCYLHYRIAYPD